jgi:hypothetical protein
MSNPIFRKRERREFTKRETRLVAGGGIWIGLRASTYGMPCLAR